MTIQTISTASLQKIRKYIAKSLTVLDVESFVPHLNEQDTFDDIPEPDSLDALGGVFNMGGLLEMEADPQPNSSEGSWAVSLVNPGDVFYQLHNLRLKPSMRLVAFVFQDHQDGRGIVWAMPEHRCTMDYLEEVVATSHHIDHPPHPPEALSDFMEAIEGDRSPASFWVASILRRELLEFGAQGTLKDWSHHRLIEAVPKALQPYWTDQHPKNLHPKFSQLPDGRAAVEFFTCRVKPPISIVRHVDQYAPNHYTAKGLQRVLVKLKAR